MTTKSVDEVLSKIDEFKLITRCRNLIQIPSYPGEEKEKGEYVAKEMERMGLEVTEVLAAKDRSNIIGVLRGNGTGRSLMLCAHLDTHWPLESQEQIAHSALVKDGNIYGIGTGDSMAPMAAIWSAVDAVKTAGIQLKGDVIFSTTVDEMTYALGARALTDSGIKADMCLIGEPTDFNIGIVHAGRAEAEVTVEGTSLVEAGPYAKQMGLP
ncbi:MAG: M20/M25/M40 family metallo-hydrolase, partial [Thaumarchaeota archaeon]|nr:M20/M25/M40 family metallo-hydrolase [Nitrososphaerota archaeon]